MNNQWVRHQYCHAVLNMSASNTLKSKLFTPTLADYYVFLFIRSDLRGAVLFFCFIIKIKVRISITTIEQQTDNNTVQVTT